MGAAGSASCRHYSWPARITRRATQGDQSREAPGSTQSTVVDRLPPLASGGAEYAGRSEKLQRAASVTVDQADLLPTVAPRSQRSERSHRTRTLDRKVQLAALSVSPDGRSSRESMEPTNPPRPSWSENNQTGMFWKHDDLGSPDVQAMEREGGRTADGGRSRCRECRCGPGTRGAAGSGGGGASRDRAVAIRRARRAGGVGRWPEPAQRPAGGHGCSRRG
jgi:hypothetical protein